MKTFVDTSVLVRYLTGDPPETLAAARRVVDETPSLLVTSVVLAETAYVLQSFYKVPRAALVDNLIDLLRKKNLGTFCLDKTLAVQALLLCRPSKRVSFADALLWAVARSAGDGGATIYTFDERFPGEGVELKG